MSLNGYSATQRRILAVLSDGMPHSKQELHTCLSDEIADLKAVKVHICHIRKSLRLHGEDIICEFANYKIFYRHVRLLHSSTDGTQ